MKIQGYDAVCYGAEPRKKCRGCPLYKNGLIVKPVWRITGIDKCLTEFKNHFLYEQGNERQNTLVGSGERPIVN